MSDLGRLPFLLGAALLAVAVVSWMLRRQGRLFAWLAGLSAIALAAGAGLVVDVLYLEPNLVVVNHLRVHNPALAQALQGVKIVQLTDLHVVDHVPWRVRRMVGLVNRLAPDVVLITGDFISDRGGLEPCLAALDALHRPRYGIWAIPGNTDEMFYGPEELAQRCQAHGITLLVNQQHTLMWGNHAPFVLAGVDDPTYGRDRLDQTLEEARAALPVLLLAHSASESIVAQATARGIPLMLTGHTHGGQVGLPWLWKFSEYTSRTPYMSGRYRAGDTTIYVNRGIGMKTRDVRFLCPPEVTLIAIEGAA